MHSTPALRALVALVATSSARRLVAMALLALAASCRSSPPVAADQAVATTTALANFEPSRLASSPGATLATRGGGPRVAAGESTAALARRRGPPDAATTPSTNPAGRPSAGGGLETPGRSY